MQRAHQQPPLKALLDALLDELSDAAKASPTVRRWLAEAERKGVGPGAPGLVSTPAVGGGGGGGGSLQRLRVEEKLLYRSLLGLGNS